MSDITIWHNPDCGISRKVSGFIRDSGAARLRCPAKTMRELLG